MYLIENRCSSISHSFLKRRREILKKQSLKSQTIDENSSKNKSERILITKINDVNIIMLIHITLKIVTQNI